MDEKNWTKILFPVISDGDGSSYNFAVIILNHCFDNLLSGAPLSVFFESTKFQTFQRCWNNAAIRMSVDGGTNSLRRFQKLGQNLIDPTYITGDFDSIQEDVMEYFRKQEKPSIIHTPDQNYTDFDKAFFVLKEKVLEIGTPQLDCVLVFYTNFGRIDQYLSILSTAHRQSGNPAVPPVVMVDLTGSISMVLNPEPVFHSIPRLPKSQWCSLVPLCGPVTLTTTGLRWNLVRGTLTFEKFISTSNEFDPEHECATVQIFGDKQILFSVQFEF